MLVGFQRAKELLFLGDNIPADEAARAGIDRAEAADPHPVARAAGRLRRHDEALEREYVVRRERSIKALKREVPRACVAVESRETMEKPMLAPPYCEAKWTAEGEHELEVPVGESCTVTIDGITRVAV